MLQAATNQKQLSKFYASTFFALIFLLICRIIAMCYVPVNDYSEARYGEIARKMLETGNWVTPLHTYQIPFWAKPPLSTWLSAASMKFLGINEFAVRFPALILSIAILFLVWSLAKSRSGPVAARFATVVLAATLYFFLDAGTVMTDPSLIFCTTLSMVAFWRAVVDKNTFWSYLFFVGLGLGMLAKGPIAVILVGMPIFFWVLIRKQWLQLWQRLPWIKGSLLAIAIFLPWYVLAEMRTPGFLNYFIIGEHFNRFLHPGWTGDRYGHAHVQHWGMIWLFAMAGIFPWSIPGLAWLARYWKKMPALYRDEDGWMTYLLCFILVPLVFFTFASNIIYTYTFPCLAAYALYFTESWQRTQKSLTDVGWLVPLAVTTGAIFLMVTLVFVYKPELIAKTQKPIVTAWIKQNPAPGSSLIFWEYSPAYSAEFYASGKIDSIKDIKKLCTRLSNQKENYLVIDPTDLAQIPSEISSKFTQIYKEVYKDKTRVLMRVSEMTC